MWSQRLSGYAPQGEADEFGSAPQHRQRGTRWQRFKSWARDRPVAVALLSLLAVGAIIGVIVGPVIGLRNRDKGSEVETIPPGGTEYQVTFQAKNTSQLCSNFSEPQTLSSYGSTLQSSIANLLGVATENVNIRSMQCDDVDDLQVGARRLLQSPADGTYALVVVFWLIPAPDSSPGGGGANPAPPAAPLPSPMAVVAALQSAPAREVLQELISRALGVPRESVVLLSVVAVSAAGSPPPAEPGPAPVPFFPPPTYAGPAPAYPPPMYAGPGPAYPPQAPPSYGYGGYYPSPPLYGGAYGTPPPPYAGTPGYGYGAVPLYPPPLLQPPVYEPGSYL